MRAPILEDQLPKTSYVIWRCKGGGMPPPIDQFCTLKSILVLGPEISKVSNIRTSGLDTIRFEIEMQIKVIFNPILPRGPIWPYPPIFFKLLFEKIL